MKKINKSREIRLSEAKGADITGVYCERGNIAYLLIDSANNRKDKGITFIQNDDSELYLSYEEILQKALIRLGGMQASKIKKGQNVLLLFDNSIDFVVTFWACVLGGIIPAPLIYPTSTKNENASLKKLANVWNVLEKPLMLSDKNLESSSGDLQKITGFNEMKIIDSSSFDEKGLEGKINLADKDSTAFIQFSSGSTNTPKGVILTHNNLLTNVEAIITSAKLTSEDVSLGWMPYHHDMGLIGFHLTITAAGISQYNMTPYKFVKRSSLWLELISKHRVTITGAPNFGYKLVLNTIKPKLLESLDLSCVKHIFNGAEPISVALMEEFMDKLSVCGLNKSAMYPVYGMAEACLAVSFPIPFQDPIIHTVNRQKLVSESKVTVEDIKVKNALRLVDEGYPVNGTEIRIVDSNGSVVCEGTVGEIQIRGNNVTSGYINNPEANKASFQDGWLKTGDTGFMIDCRVTVVGRLKDIIFVNGQNFFAHDIEAVIDEIEGVVSGKIVVCGWHDEAEGREKVALFSTLRIKKDNVKAFYSKILKHVNEVFGIPIDFVVSVLSIPKTTSGKIQRFNLVEAFKNNEYDGKIIQATELSAEYVDEVQEKSSEGSKLADTICQIWSKVLERPTSAISYDQPFLSIGGTSIKAIQILGLLEDELGLKLTHDLLIKGRTISDMEEYILKILDNKELYNQSLSEIKKSESKNLNEDDQIAVISMACRFPDASNPEEFWDNILGGKCSIGEIPSERWNIDEYYSSTSKFGKTYCRTGAFVNNAYDFDNGLFNIVEKEAEIMDPQQRLILELVFELIERAGYSRQSVGGKKVGLFIGASTNSYYEYHLSTLNKINLQSFESFVTLPKEQQDLIMEEWKSKFGITEDHPNIIVDNILNMIAARASQEFNFKGPALVIDTACSSSLVTIHMACESLKRGESEMAIAGGVNLLLTPTPYIYFSSAGALSVSGASKVFDADADGFVPGEGVGLIMLKPLKKAIEDKNEILAVIKASAINNDGHSIGVMAPNPDGQREVIESLYWQNDLNPSSIQYVETHGTGTRIGDPSEIRALNSAFENWKLDKNSIAIGSIKSNVGHLLSAAGVGSFIKVVMAMMNKKMPPQINVKTPNPMIKFSETPFYILNEARSWDTTEQAPRRAAINSFGFGGTNCHVVVEERPSEAEIASQDYVEKPKHLLCMSANTEAALEQKIRKLTDFLEIKGDYSIGDVCYTENALRSSLKHRSYFIADDIMDMVEKLKKASLGDAIVATVPKTALMFTGQGSQYVGMGRGLYEKLPAFKKYVDICSDAFLPYLNIKISDLIYGENAEDKFLAQTNITQPVVFTMDYSIGMLMLELGVKPRYVLGHSVGEWVAACIAGAVSLEDAARLVSVRGRLMSELKVAGAMAAVFTTSSKIEELIMPYEGSLWVAGYNLTHQVVSGKSYAMDEFMKEIQKKGVGAKRLNVSQAFHTPLMTPMLEEFKKELEITTFNLPEIPIVSNVTAQVYDKPFSAEYWLEHILGAVRFEQSVKFMLNKGINILIECGPDKILSGMASGLAAQNISILPAMDRKKDNWDVLLSSIGKLYSLGEKIKWDDFYKGDGCKKVSLPSYPFERKTFMPDFGKRTLSSFSGKINNWFHEWSWKQESEAQTFEFSEGAVIVFCNDEEPKIDFDGSTNNEKKDVYYVTFGEEFSYDDNWRFIINPKRQEDYFKLLYSVDKISAIIHLWNYSQKALEPIALIENEEVLYNSAYSLLLLGKALQQCSIVGLRLMLVTNRAFCISDEYVMQNPHQSIAIALGQALDTEIKGLAASVLDIDSEDYDSQAEVAKTIIDELQKKPNSEAAVAIRKNHRFIRSLQKATMSKQEEDICINEGETYLITGGTGLIGGKIAEAFAKRTKVNLVLTGRGALPPKEEWNENLTKAESLKVNMIQKLQNLGANVEYFSVDVSEKTQMEEMVAKVNEKLGSIHGVVHAAGILDDSSYKFLDKDPENLKKVLSAKVNGTMIADMATQKEPLKFFVSISSVSASKKEWSVGIADYAAANYFLDIFSSYRARTASPGKSLAMNYSLWDTNGKGIVSGDIFNLAVKAQGLNPLPLDGATEAFVRALNYKNQSVIHIIDLMEGKKQTLEKEVKSISQENKAGVLRKTAQEIRSIVHEIIENELSVDADNIDDDMNFLEMGMNSIDATKVVAKIGKMLDLELYPTLIFEYQTPEALIKYIEETYAYTEGKTNETTKIISVEEARDKDDIQDIAIIGIGLRIPEANTLEEYWDLLKNGKCVIKEVPEDRWSVEENYNPDKNSLHTTYCKHGGFIDKPYDFDPLFFGMSPVEAQATDPQQRIFMQIVWEAIQQAGYGGKNKSNKIGVFVGAEQNTYSEHFLGYRTYMLLKNRLEKSQAYKNMSPNERKEVMTNVLQVVNPGNLVADAVAGNGLNEIAARISHCLNLSGPSFIMNSACSSSLVALHMACESLRTSQADMAIAGGVNLNLSATPFVSLSRVTALSASGKCYPFDKRADGMVLSEGAGAVLLKPLKYALRDKDNIFAVIKGSAINNDGHSQGITAPRPHGQAEVIRDAYVRSGINPETVSYIETHGTATPLGDPIEIEGMTHAMLSFTSKKQFCGIGSVKSSIGHMLSAAGVVSLIKVVLALKNKTIPHTVNYEEPNPNIDFGNSPFYVVGKKPREWKREEGPLRAAVNAFGFGGTNAHVILEEAPEIEMTSSEVKREKQEDLICLTGRNEKVVRSIARNLREYMKKETDMGVASICATMNNSQKELACKTAVVINSREHLLDVLSKIENNDVSSEIIQGRSNPNRVTPLSLVIDCSLELSKTEVEKIAKRFPAFDDAYNECKQIFKNEGGVNNQIEKAMEGFAQQYALGVMLGAFEIKLKNIVCEGIAVLVGAALTGVVTIGEAARLLMNKNNYGNKDVDESIRTVLRCPAISPVGIINRESLCDFAEYMQNISKGKESLDYLKEILYKDEAVIYIGGNRSKGREIDKLKIKNLQWIEFDIGGNSIGALLKAMAKLYTIGVSYNPVKLNSEVIEKVALPTYPFENSEYKVTFEDKDLDLSSAVEVHIEEGNQLTTIKEIAATKEILMKHGLKKINVFEDISDAKKISSIRQIKSDLDKLG